MIEYTDSVLNSLKEFISGFAPAFLKAIVTLIIGIIVLKLILRFISKLLARSKKIDESLKGFLESLLKIGLYFVLIAVVGTVLGIKANSFIAIIGAAGIAIGLALQGSLANFAGGMIIIGFKPFKIGDWVEIDGSFGVVHKIDILYTRLKTFDERILTFPNGTVANTKIDNWTQTELRRINLHFQIPLEEDVEEIRQIMLKVMNDHPDVLKYPEASVWLDSIDQYAMNIYARSYCKNELYYPTIWNHLENIKKALDEKGIKIQVPRTEVVYEKK